MKAPTKAILRHVVKTTADILDAWAKQPPRAYSRDWQRAFTQQAAWMRKEAKI